MQVARSKINDRAGARTQMAGLITGVLALIAIFFLLPYFYYLPKAVLSSIIFVAVLSLLGELPEDLHFIFKVHAWRDLTLLLVTFFGTVIISLEFGTLVAITLSLLLTIKQSSYPRISIMVLYIHWLLMFANSHINIRVQPNHFSTSCPSHLLTQQHRPPVMYPTTNKLIITHACHIYPCRGESKERTTNLEPFMKIQMKWNIWKMSSLSVLKNPYFLPIQVKETHQLVIGGSLVWMYNTCGVDDSFGTDVMISD